jgi:hypothetical protein
MKEERNHQKKQITCTVLNSQKKGEEQEKENEREERKSKWH